MPETTAHEACTFCGLRVGGVRARDGRRVFFVFGVTVAICEACVRIAAESVRRHDEAPAVDAVDPHVGRTGNPSPREKESDVPLPFGESPF